MHRFAGALYKRSIMLWLALAFLAVSAIGIGGMALATMVAERVQGSGSAINVAGSLRRLSHRMGSIVLSDAENRVADRAVLREAIGHFEDTLRHGALLDGLARHPDSPARDAYARVLRAWEQELKPLLGAQTQPQSGVASGQESDAGAVQDHNRLLLRIDAFVRDIDHMVAQMEADTEARVRLLRLTLLAALGLMVLVLFLGLLLIHRRVLRPLEALLAGAEGIARGDFSARTLHVGRDELGQVGQAFNTMAAAVARSHRELEDRVRDKTAALTRSNNSLALLYQAISQLHHAPTAPDTYRAVLAELDALLELQGSMACLQAKHGGPATLLASSAGMCELRGVTGCADCLAGLDAPEGLRIDPGGHRVRVLKLPLRDRDGTYGVLRLILQEGRQLDPWQEQLLAALTRHMGIALGMSRRLEQERLLALQEERSVIARELHDSIAQALSYLKIQVSLLQPVLSAPEHRVEAEAILSDLRTGITTAYRQLRELLATFRMKMEGDFMALLEAAVAEYSVRGGLPIHLETRLTDCRLSPNQEIHTLHVVREALSNVLRHAQARQAWVSMVHRADGRVETRIEDDGVGLGAVRETNDERFHYGIGIMQERARGLHGQLRMESRPSGGTRVTLVFMADPQLTETPIEAA